MPVVRTHYEFPAETSDTLYRLRLHKRVPFGVASAKLTIQTDNEDKGMVEYRLIDMGTNAKSAIPETK